MHKSSPLTNAATMDQAERLIQDAISRMPTISIYGTTDVRSYLHAHRGRIVDQLAVEINLLRDMDRASARVLCVGGWPGITAICLREMGCVVTAIEHPSLVNDEIATLYDRASVVLQPLDMANVTQIDPHKTLGQDYTLIECCQCIEPWPFNPIPALMAMIDALDEDGSLYITVPNAVSLYRRVTVLMGRNPFPSIDDFKLQMNASSCAAVSPHWREYTRRDLADVVRASGGDLSMPPWYQFHSRRDKAGMGRLCYDLCQIMMPVCRDHIGALVQRKGPRGLDHEDC